MRKLKILAKNTEKKYTENEIVFYGIAGMLKRSIFQYLEMFKDNKITINYTGSSSPVKALEKALLIISEITNNCDKKKWSDEDILKIEKILKRNYAYLDSVFSIKTKEDIEKERIYQEDYDLVSIVIVTKEFFKAEQKIGKKIIQENKIETHYLSLSILELINKLIPNLSRIHNFFFNEIYFNNPPKPTNILSEFVEIEVFIGENGELINTKGIYSSFILKDLNETEYCAGFDTNGKLYVSKTDGNYILNKAGKKLKWRMTEKRKEDRLIGLYKFHDYEIVTNMRRFNFDLLLEECKNANISNVNIFKSLIEMSGFVVE